MPRREVSVNTNQFAEFTSAVVRSLPRDIEPTTCQAWIENQNGLAKVLREALMPPKKVEEQVPKTFSVWKTIKLGTGLTSAYQFRKAIKKAGGKISDYANDILGKPAFRAAIKEVELELDLVNVSVAELGFANGATRREIYERAIKLGLELCPSEVGPQLRLQYKDQPLNEWVLVGMEPIADSGGGPRVFHVAHVGGGLWLSSNDGLPVDVWSADYRWLFVRSRK